MGSGASSVPVANVVPIRQISHEDRPMEESPSDMDAVIATAPDEEAEQMRRPRTGLKSKPDSLRKKMHEELKDYFRGA
eukprot:Skav228546  [mRNA]  locus=scaffold1887:501138:503127:+ [translate_table: standard]